MKIRKTRRWLHYYGFTNEIVKQILLRFLTLLPQASASGAKPLVVTEMITIIPVVYQNDYTTLKPGLMVDQNKKVIVGIRKP